MASDLESQMVSVERITNYCDNITPEAAYVKASDPKDDGTMVNPNEVSVNIDVEDGDVEDMTPSSGIEMQQVWPSKGVIEFRSVCLRYRPGLPLVLNNCSFVVKGSEKVGVVGRTGIIYLIVIAVM